MKNLVGNGKYFKFDAKINRKPENRCNVAELCGNSNNTSSCILNALKLFNQVLK